MKKLVIVVILIGVLIVLGMKAARLVDAAGPRQTGFVGCLNEAKEK